MHCRQDTGLQTRNRSDAAFPIFEKPLPIGYFSLDTQRMYHPTDEQLRYYRAPSEYPLDLNAGMDKAIKKPESVKDERLDHLFRYIFDNREKVMVPNSPYKKLFAEFASWRGLLRLIMCTPFEKREDWCIQITRFRGTCYMVQKETAYHKRQRENETLQQKKMFSWGFKFEQYCLSDSPLEKPNTQEPVDECAEFSAVFQVKLQKIPLLYGAEMDGVIADQPISLKNDPSQLKDMKFVELKTRQGIDCHERQHISYQTYKTRNWWCQSFLTGVEDIFVGLRDEHGLVHKIERIPVRSLPGQGQNYWSPHICANFLLEFLIYVRELMKNVNCPYTVYDFYFHARSGSISYRCLQGQTEHSFLPDWYLQIFDNTTKFPAIEHHA